MWCGGTDRFHVWERGGIWFAKCNQGSHFQTSKGTRQIISLNYLSGKNNRLSREEKLQLAHAEKERQEQEIRERMEKIQALTNSRIWEEYYKNIWNSQKALDYLAEGGITSDLITQFILGYNPKFGAMIDSEYTYVDAITFPHFREMYVNGVPGWYCTNIRHRILGLAHQGYRPYTSGLGIDYFNALQEKPTEIIVTEGEKKAIVLNSRGFSAIGLWGVEVFDIKWINELTRWRVPIIVLFDNDGNKSVQVAGDKLSRALNARYAHLEVPGKVDDVILAGYDIKGLIERTLLEEPLSDVIIL